MSLWLVVVAAGLATYATRALPLVAVPPLPERGAARTYVDALPTSVLAALAGASIIAPGDALTGGAEPVAALIVALVAAWRRQILLAMLAGIAAVALLRSIGAQ